MSVVSEDAAAASTAPTVGSAPAAYRAPDVKDLSDEELAKLGLTKGIGHQVLPRTPVKFKKTKKKPTTHFRSKYFPVSTRCG